MRLIAVSGRGQVTAARYKATEYVPRERERDRKMDSDAQSDRG